MAHLKSRGEFGPGGWWWLARGERRRRETHGQGQDVWVGSGHEIRPVPGIWGTFENRPSTRTSAGVGQPCSISPPQSHFHNCFSKSQVKGLVLGQPHKMVCWEFKFWEAQKLPSRHFLSEATGELWEHWPCYLSREVLGFIPNHTTGDSLLIFHFWIAHSSMKS